MIRLTKKTVFATEHLECGICPALIMEGEVYWYAYERDKDGAILHEQTLCNKCKEHHFPVVDPWGRVDEEACQMVYNTVTCPQCGHTFRKEE